MCGHADKIIRDYTLPLDDFITRKKTDPLIEKSSYVMMNYGNWSYDQKDKLINDHILRGLMSLISSRFEFVNIATNPDELHIEFKITIENIKK